MNVRLCNVGLRGAAVAMACAIVFPASTSALGIGPITIGGGSSSTGGLPSVQVEVPAPSGPAPLVGVGVSSEGVKVTTPLTPTVEVQTPKQVEVPPVKAETPVGQVETPKVEPPAPPKVEVPKSVTTPSHEATAGSTGSASNGGGSPSHSTDVPGSTGAGVAASRSTARSASARARHGTGQSGAAGGSTSSGGSPTSPGSPSRLARTGAVAGGVSASRGGPTAQRSHRGSSDPLSSLGASLPLPLPVPDWSKPIILLLALLAIAFATRWWLASRRAGRLERRQRALLRDIEVMQAALVPEVPERLQALEVSVAYRPAEGPAAGGDFYDVFELGPDRVAVILGDVAGHGHDAVRRAALTRYTLRAFLKETGEPRATLALAGHALSEPGFEQLATVAIAVFDSARGTLTYALAGHPPPLLLGVPAGDTPAACSSPPVGCELPTGRRQRTVSLPAGARALLFSDGLIEARCAETTVGHPDLLGRERLAELFAGLPSRGDARELLGAVREASSATPDDMAACIVTSRAAGARRAIDHEILEVGGRIVADGHLDSYLRGSGLGESGAERVLRATRTQLKSHETAVLVVDRSRGQAEVGVRPGRERAAAARSGALPEPSRVRLLQA